MDAGFNFRATAGYVTDGTGECPVLGEVYPQTYSLVGGGTIVAGWETTGPDITRDRDSTLDRRLAGQNAHTIGAVALTFRVDLPAAGDYIIDLAYGDGNAGVGADAANITLKDDTTALATVTAQPAAGQMIDASNNAWSYANWPGSKVPLTKTFSSTIFRLVLGDSPTHFAPLAHVRLTSSGGGGPTSHLLSTLGVGA